LLVNYKDSLVGSDTNKFNLPMTLLTYATEVPDWVFGRDTDCPD